jgi:glycogen operon protein
VKILVYLILNGYCEPLDFELPKPQSGTPWKRWIDTSLPSPNDIVEWQLAPEISGATYRVPGHSAIMLYTAARQDSTDPSDRELS